MAKKNRVYCDNFNNDTKIKLEHVRNCTIKVNLVSEYEFHEIVNNLHVKNELDWNDFKNLLLKMFEYPQPVSDNRAKLKVIILACSMGDKNPCYCSYLIMQLYVALTSLPLAIIHVDVLTVLMVSDFENSLTNPHSSLAKVLLAFSCVFIPVVFLRIGLIIVKIVQLCYQRD